MGVGLESGRNCPVDVGGTCPFFLRAEHAGVCLRHVCFLPPLSWEVLRTYVEFMRSDVGHLSSRLLCREGRSDLANTKEMLPPWLSCAGLPGQLPTDNANSLEEGPASVGPLRLDGTQSSLSGYPGLLWGDLQAGELATSFLLYLSQHWGIGRC